MKKLSFLCMIIILFGALAGCGKGGSQTVNINFPTATTTGTIYPLGSAMANVWNNRIDNIRVTAQASNGGVHNLNMMRDGEAQVSFATSGIILDAIEGRGPFEGRAYKDVRILAGLYSNPNQFVVRQGARIENIADIKGRNFAPGASGSTPEVESGILLREYGLDYPNDIRPHFVGFTEAIDLMRNNQIDGAYIQAGIPTAAVTEMTSTADGKLLSIDEHIIQSLLEKYPWYSRFTIPANTYANQPTDIETVAIKMMLIVDASVSEDLVYKLTKEFWENLDEIKPVHPIVEQIKIEAAVTGLSGIPLHPGAEKYYKEIGILD